jgi:tyrosinase
MSSLSLSRRSFVRGFATVPIGFWLAAKVHAQTTYVRYDIATPKGQEMLRVFAGAVKKMKALSDRNATGWRWQWYTHFVSGATTKSSELTRIFGSTSSAQRTLANDMWNTCQSHAGQDPNHFMPWHRIFVYYLEHIVREVSGRTDFTLPYWNYTSHDPAKRGVVPRQFRLASDAVFAPLYRSDRTSLANSGQPIHKYQAGDAMDISTAMAKQNYSTSGSVTGFCRDVDSGIHGRIHVLVGTSKNMGKISYAAQDPLFWVHHANIDRLWASWNANGHTNPTSGSWRDRSFVFADRLGLRINARLKDFFDTRALGYTYDRYVGPDGREGTASSTFAAAAAVGSIGRIPERVAAGRPVELGARPASTVLTVEGNRPVTALDPSGEKRTYLIVKDLHTWAQPEVLYHLYLVPRGAGQRPDQFVGSIQFFDAEFHDHGQSELDEALGENFYSFDVTPLLQRLAAAHAIRKDVPLELVLVPGGRPTPGARPMVGTIQLVWQ